MDCIITLQSSSFFSSDLNLIVGNVDASGTSSSKSSSKVPSDEALPFGDTGHLALNSTLHESLHLGFADV